MSDTQSKSQSPGQSLRLGFHHTVDPKARQENQASYASVASQQIVQGSSASASSQYIHVPATSSASAMSQATDSATVNAAVASAAASDQGSATAPTDDEGRAIFGSSRDQLPVYEPPLPTAKFQAKLR